MAAGYQTTYKVYLEIHEFVVTCMNDGQVHKQEGTDRSPEHVKQQAITS